MNIKNEQWDKRYKSIFISKLLNENTWLKNAKALIDAASSFEPEVYRVWDAILSAQSRGEDITIRVEYFGTYYMLIAYAIENILKAKIISKKCSEFKKYVEQKWELPPDLKNHNLFKLAKDVNISLNSSEESYLRRLSRAAIWAGRYPVPTKYKGLMGKKYSDGELHMESFFTRGEIEKIKKLLDKLLET